MSAQRSRATRLIGGRVYAAASVRHVFLTRSDRDHTGGLTAFSGAEIPPCAREKAVIDGGVPRRFPFLKRRNRLEAAYTPLEDGEAFTAGSMRVRAIWTPGSRLISNDAEENERSMRELAERVPEASLLCTGHSGYTTDYRYAMARYLPAKG
jgi:hypothetical protein